MAMSLKVLLDRVRGAREALPHLAALEPALLQGLAWIDTVSLPVLSRICAQLASLPVADSDTPLQDLQARLLAALERRGSPTAAPAAPVLRRPLAPSVAAFDRTVTVTEISHSEFLAAAAGLDDTVPMAHCAPAETPIQSR